jgi:hypothetical protein
VIWRHDERQLIGDDWQGSDGRVVRLEGYDANLDVATDDLAGDAAGQAAFDFDLDVRVTGAKRGYQRQ